MAKGKHSTALFEVIHSAKRPDRIAQSLRTPKWWFKGRQSADANSTDAPVTYQEPDPAPPGPVVTASEPAPAPAPPTRTVEPDRSRSRSSAVHVDFDRDRKEIRLRLRYTTALVSGFGVCVLIGLSYIAGRHLGHGPRTASAESADIQQLMNNPPRPDVTNIQRQKRSQVTGPVDPPRHSSETPKVTTPQTVVTRPQSQQPRSLVPAGVENSLPRIIGLNYVIIQTYPPEERQAAEAARDYLTRNGIPCTLEKAADFTRNPSWICLMGTAGFAHISAPEYKQYVENILALGDKFKTSHFNRWNPGAYKYKGQSQE